MTRETRNTGISSSPGYVLRLNGDPGLTVSVEHVEETGDMVTVRDVGEFPVGMFKEPVRITLVELFDESGELCAARRIPTRHAVTASDAQSVVVQWELFLRRALKGGRGAGD